MKILVSTDLEGVAGVAVDRQLGGIDNPYYRKARELQAEEINAALCGAREAGADDFVVCDGHGSGYDMMFDFERLVPEARFVTGTGGFSFSDLRDEGFAALFIVGQHPRRGPRGSLEHTGSDVMCQGAWLNGWEVGEAGMQAAELGELGVPLALVTGDEEVVKEVDALGCGTVGVAVKRGLCTRQRCLTLHPVEARRRIREGAARALRSLDRITPWKVPPPYRLTIKYGSASVAERYAPLGRTENPEFSYVTRVDADTVAVNGRSWSEVFRRHALMNRVV